MEGCIPPLLSASEGDLILRNSSSIICPLCHLSPLALIHISKDVNLLQLCCRGSRERRGQTLPSPIPLQGTNMMFSVGTSSAF